jgi:hypothetical protein
VFSYPCYVIWNPTYREQVERIELGRVNTVSKQHFTYLYSSAREKAFTKRNILEAWRESSLFLFNPERVLIEFPKPLVKLTILTTNKLKVDPCPDYKALPTPATPVSREALASLLDRIKLVPNNKASS